MSPTEYTYAGHIMGCDFTVSIVTHTASVADAAYTDAFAIARDYEQIFSRFDPHSELSLLNIAREITPSQTFFDILSRARTLFRETAGYFNPLVQIAQHGYTTSFEHLQHHAPQVTNQPIINTDFDTTIITPHRIALAPHQRIDVAGFLKGYVAHQVADTLHTRYNLEGCVINIGGDIATRGQSAHHTPFMFDIYNPVTDTEISLPLADTSLSTSGTYRRHWRTAEHTVHHILSPHTHANPATDLVSATVITPDGARSDAYATVAIVLGAAAAREFLTTHNCAFILITHDGTVHRSMK